MKTPRSMSYALISGLLAFAALQGCSDDEDGNPKPPVVIPSEGGQDNEGGTGNTGNRAGTQSNPGGAPSEGGTTSQPTAGQPSEGGGAGAPPEPTCDLPPLGEDGCFNCPENGEVEQWLNRCVDSECEPFDNSQARLPLINANGSLPALPN
jgi:hypothetical protein